ncbi:TspO/MBR family protein [Arenimonas sp. MALMAid1274]|uniref:TspO/MBR family protein n=1 Tax=Arenimonas sp. MALMAid1274 TaxID=3411630 RepID=UPI003B9ED7F2
MRPVPGFNASLDPQQTARAGTDRSPRRSRLHSGVMLAVFVIAVCAAGMAAGLLFPPGEWHEQLAKPTWNPPDWVFSPVWATLYVLLATSAWLVWREPGVSWAERRGAWTAFAAHALLNLAWTPLYFGARQPGWAFLDISLLWLAVIWLTLRFGRIKPLAGYLLIPLVLWESFALVLNGTIWLMNT